MRSAYYLRPNQQSSSIRRRAVALALTLVAHLLLLLVLLTLAPPLSFGPKDDRGLITFDVAPEAQKASPKPKAAADTKRASEARPPPPPAPPPPLVPPKLNLIPGLEKFDLRQVRSSLPSPNAEFAGQGSPGQGETSGSTYGPGEGPGGARLYNAEWYREPTQAELAYYLPARPQTGWGMIACQTVEKYRVENCRELGSDPPGSGLSGAIRKAAWQFLVRPPTIDGKPVVGSWVRIRIDFTERGAVIDRSHSR